VLIDRSHKAWATFSIVALLLAGGYFGFYYYTATQPGGPGWSSQSWTGLAYGIVGFGMMIFCGLLGVRRRVRIWRLGKGQSWLRAHIWLGLLAFPIIYFHAGMRFGNNLTLWLMILFAIVLVSGILGVILQNILPHSLLMRVPAETTYEQVPHVIDCLRTEADSMVSKVCGQLGNVAAAPESELMPSGGMGGTIKTVGPVQGKIMRSRARNTGPLEGAAPLKQFYLAEVQPFLRPEFKGKSTLATQRGAVATFAHARTLVPEPLHETLKDLESVCEERRQLAVQVNLHEWLHCWEFIHVPLSYALLVMSAVHATIATLKY